MDNFKGDSIISNENNNNDLLILNAEPKLTSELNYSKEPNNDESKNKAKNELFIKQKAEMATENSENMSKIYHTSIPTTSHKEADRKRFLSS